MVYIETQYFNVNKILLLAIGLWPYRQSKIDRLQIIFFSGILLSAILFQFTVFFTSKCTSDLIMKILSSVIFFVISVIKYFCFGINIETVKNLLMELQHTHNKLNDENEIAIIKEYAYNTKRYTIMLIILFLGSIFILVPSQIYPNILNTTLLINESRQYRMQFIVEYFVDQRKYFFIILLHMDIAFLLAGVIMVAIGLMLLGYIQYICGMFKISSYHIKCAIKINISRDISSKNESLINDYIIQRIIHAVDIHRQATKLSTLLISKFEAMFLFITIFNVLSLSINLYRIFQIALSESDVMDSILPFIVIFFCTIYMFLSHYIGQDVTNHNSHVFCTVYDIQWYVTSLRVQKLILFLLQKGTKNFTLSIGGLFIGSLECFATLAKASLSYFTVIYSTR
ncbi:hypothetical protein HN011_008100 [Eciton burchellii]|nr:hypothetical protein HN011_008100 [Eciton burchellii]